MQWQQQPTIALTAQQLVLVEESTQLVVDMLEEDIWDTLHRVDKRNMVLLTQSSTTAIDPSSPPTESVFLFR